MQYLHESHGRSGIYAKLVAASISVDNVRIYTIETCAPKFIDAEFEKHRMLSSNSSSSRAITTEKLLGAKRFVPFSWRKEQKGMQGYEELSNTDALKAFWLNSTDVTESFVRTLKEFGVHKQISNRPLEWFTLQKKVVTATEWDNFFKLRLAENVQPEMYELAKCIKDCIDSAKPRSLRVGEWHVPYVEDPVVNKDSLIRSVACCARVSYDNHDGTAVNKEKDAALFDMLLSNGHLTPFEHQACVTSLYAIFNCDVDWWPEGITHVDRNKQHWSGNFRGFVQYRQLVSTWNG
jgi:thymidylate synthase ThyX